MRAIRSGVSIGASAVQTASGPWRAMIRSIASDTTSLGLWGRRAGVGDRVRIRDEHADHADAAATAAAATTACRVARRAIHVLDRAVAAEDRAAAGALAARRRCLRRRCDGIPTV